MNRWDEPEWVVREELGKLGWKETELARRRKGEPGKVLIARRLRQETAMTLKWISERLQMGAWKHVSNELKRHGAKLGRQPKSVKGED